MSRTAYFLARADAAVALADAAAYASTKRTLLKAADAWNLLARLEAKPSRSWIGAEHHECEVSDIIEDEQRKLVTTPAYMLAQSIAEAASGINKMVDRVLELAHH